MSRDIRAVATARTLFRYEAGEQFLWSIFARAVYIGGTVPQLWLQPMGVQEGQLLDTIYAAALDPSLWRVALAQLADAAGAEAAAITQLDIVTGTGNAISLTNETRTLADYFDYYYRINPLHLVDDAASYVAEWTPSILRDEEWLARDALESSEYYNDFLRPIGAQWGVFLRLGLSGHELTAISLGRAPRRGRFDDAEIASLAGIHSHLIRAVGLSKRFASLHHRADGLAAAVDRSRSALMLVDADGVLLHANAAAEQLLRVGDAVCVRERRLTAVDHAGAQALLSAIRGATASERTKRIAGAFGLPIRGRAETMRGAAMPLLEDSAGPFGRGAAALVSITSSIVDTNSTIDSAGDQFGLTAAESRIATDLVRGLDLRAAANRRGTTINTVRTQLASIFAKTGTHRQVDLVRLLATNDAVDLDG